LLEWYREEVEERRMAYPVSKRIMVALERKIWKEQSDKAIGKLQGIDDSTIDITEELPYIPKLIYCDEEKAVQFLVYVDGGRLCHKIENQFVPIDSRNIFLEYFGRTPEEDDNFLKNSGVPTLKPTDGKSSRSSFIVDMQKNLYIFPYRMGTIHHTFIAKYKPVLLAGTVILKNGKIDYLDNHSGHFQCDHKSILLFAVVLRKISKTSPKQLFTDDF